MADNIFSKQNGDFTRVLPPVISGTPQRSLDADSVLARANAMLAQTKTQGSTPFAGSSYERALPPPTYQNAPVPPTPVQQVSPTPPQTEPMTTNPYDAFNLLLQESLKKAQTLNPTDLLKQQRELQRQRIAKISGTAGASGQSITPEEARFLSPAQQESIQNSGMAANSTAIDEVQYQIQKVNQDKKDLLEQIMFAKDSGDKMRTTALEAEYKKKDQEFKDAQLAETKRSNLADERNAGIKAGVGGVSLPTSYVSGMNPIVDSWAERIQNGSAKITEIPASQAGLRNQVSVALQAMGNSLEGKPTTTELGRAALANAKALLKNFDAGNGTSVVGKSRLLGYGVLAPSGTAAGNFENDFKAIKAQLSLEGVKYLKGQGQVSDAERALLAQATTKLNLTQSEDSFRQTLQGIIDKLQGGAQDNISDMVTIQKPDGTQGTIPRASLQKALELGAKQI